jgi:YgiT-type zinc finger domain-containing protein
LRGDTHEPDRALWQPGFRQGGDDKVRGVQAGRDPASKTAVVLQRDRATVVINDVPARVCENCGEDYVDEQVAERVLAAAEAAARPGVKVEIRDYVAA